jgi:hypothetical protein
MPFGVTNAPSTFRAYIDDCLRPYIDDFALCDLDDILIDTPGEDLVKHQEHVIKVLQRLR